MRKRYLMIVTVVTLLLLAACSPLPKDSPVPDPTAAPAPEVVSEPTAEPAEEPETEPVEEPEAEPVEEPEAEPVEEPEAGMQEDVDHYSGVTAMDKAAVEEIARSVRRAYLEQDWEAIVDMIRYPITMYPDVEIHDGEEFLSYMRGKIVHESDAAVMEEETCEDMFANGEGICMGSGQVWLLDPNYMTDEQPMLQIIALSGIVEAGE